MRDDLQKAIAAGCNAYATKPIDKALIELIARYANRSRSATTPAANS